MNILNYFSSEKKTETVQAKNINNIIEQIHNEFDCSAEQALKEANEILAQSSNIDVNKAKLMKEIGFTSSQLVEQYSKKLEITNEATRKAKIIAYYQHNYPQYKFIFTNQVNEICNKYNLICGEISLYKGDVPMKNLLEIKNFKVKDTEKCITREYYLFNVSVDYITGSSFVEYNSPHFNYSDTPFSICAPKSDMNTKGYKLNGNFLTKEIPDPIVLYPQPWNDGYLIVSKWGLEANDESLVNELAN